MYGRQEISERPGIITLKTKNFSEGDFTIAVEIQFPKNVGSSTFVFQSIRNASERAGRLHQQRSNRVPGHGVNVEKHLPSAGFGVGIGRAQQAVELIDLTVGRSGY